MDWQEVAEQLKKYHAELVIPLIVESLLGFIIVGKKRDRSDYSSTDWNTFVLVSNNAGMAIYSIFKNEDSGIDGLTKAINQRSFPHFLGKAVAQGVRGKQAVWGGALDVDHFKDYNETYGHDEANEILRAFGPYLQKMTRESDFVCRSIRYHPAGPHHYGSGNA